MWQSESEEPNRLAGFPVSRATRYGEEPQHAMGVPLSWQEPVGESILRALLHPVWGLRERLLRKEIGSLLH